MSEEAEQEIINYMEFYNVTRDDAFFLQKFFDKELNNTPENIKELARVLRISEVWASMRFALQLGLTDSIY